MGRAGRLDVDHPDVLGEGGGDTGDQTAATDGDQNGVDLGVLLAELQPDGSLAGDDPLVVERADERQVVALRE